MDEQRLLVLARVYRDAFDRWCSRAKRHGEDDPLARTYAHAAEHALEALACIPEGIGENYPFSTLDGLDHWLVAWKRKAPDGPPDRAAE